MKRNKNQRTAYAMNRLSKAVDRVITAKSQQEKAMGRQWAALWAKAAGIKTSGQA